MPERLGAALDALFTSGHAIDIILLVLAAEALLLRWRRAASPLAILLALLPAALILLAMRAAITGAPWPVIGLLLLLAWPAHLADLRQRGWLAKSGRSPSGTRSDPPASGDR